MAARHEVEAIFKLKDEMSVQLEEIRKRAAALEKEAKGLIGTTNQTNNTFAELTKGLDRFAPGLGRVTSGVQGLTAGLSPLAIGVGAVAGAITVAGGIVAKWTSEVVDLGSELTDLAAKASVSTDFVQEFGFAGKQVGIDLKTVTDGVTVLSRRLGADLPDARKAVEALGLSMNTLVRQSPEQSFRDILAAIKGIENPAKQAAAAMALFGRQGLDFLPLIRSDFEGVIEELRALGGVMEGETAEAADKLGDQMELIGAAFQGFKNQIAGEVIPVLSELAGTFISITKFTLEWKDESDALQDSISGFTSSIGNAFPLFRNWAQEIERLAKNARWLKAVFDTFGVGALRDPFGKFPTAPGAPTGPPRPGGVAPITEQERKRVEKESEVIIKRQIQHHKDVTAAAKETQKVYDEQLRTLRELDRAAQALVSGMGLIDAEALGMAESWAATDDEIRAVIASMEEVLVQQAKIGSEMGFHIETAEEMRDIVESFPSGVGDIESLGVKDFSLALRDAADLVTIFGDSLGEIAESFIKGSAIGDLLSRTFKELDIESKDLGLSFAAAGAFLAAWSATGSGSQGKRALSGAAAGAAAGGAIVPGWGHAIGAGVGALVGWLRGRGPAQVGEDAGRDIGVELSQSLKEAIHKSGVSAQLFLTEIFAEGNLGIDRFAEEVGDLFSMFEQGKLGESDLIRELQEDLPIIIEHFGELGDVGKAQLERILGAADAAGISLGEFGDQLRRLMAGIPEITEEAFQEQFGATQEQVDALEKLLDIDLDTQIERLADQFDVPVDLMDQLATKMEELGLDVTDLPEILASLGVSFEKFIEDLLGIELPEVPELPGETAGEPGAPLDPAIFGDTAGAIIANHLLPQNKQISMDIGLMRGDMGRLGPIIAKAVAEAIARANG